ncbi:PRTRC system protein F [Pseudoduganella sp. R-34]|uniref:PRTRC system protein F n=1 Tax=Pseudoduganella sp. R-34 TaxID=3404062 RepID=UPI003CF301F9
MQLNETEMRLLQGAIPQQSLPTLFQVPSIHASVPRHATQLRYQTDFTDLARQLLKAGVIDPEDIPTTASTPAQIVGEGVGAWFNRRINGLQHMRFDIEILDAECASNLFDGHVSSDLTFESAVLTITGSGAELRYVEDIARRLEAKVPGLFLTAFSELVAASYKSIEIQHPERILEGETSYSLWGDDIWSVTDEEAREQLIERYGDEEDVNIEIFMPDAILEAYGNGFCFDICRESRRPKKLPEFSDQKLSDLARSSDNEVASVATRLLSLRQAFKRVVDLKARLKLPEGFEGRSLYVGCILLFNADDRCSQFQDQEGQYLFESGEGTDLHAAEQLPKTATQLKKYFQKLDALFDLIAQIDALIPAISYSNDTE